jgi:succinate dehydrogenase / fumarate reductase flavoprotein subunit
MERLEVIARNLVTGEIERHSAHAVVIASGGYGNVFSCLMQWEVTLRQLENTQERSFFANLVTQIHPTCIPVSGDHQSKLTLMSESLRNDGRIWVPAKLEDRRFEMGRKTNRII